MIQARGNSWPSWVEIYFSTLEKNRFVSIKRSEYLCQQLHCSHLYSNQIMHLTGIPFDISGVFPSRKGAGISASLLWVSQFPVSIGQNPSLIHNTKSVIT